MLERTYDNLFRIWLQDGGNKPIPNTSDQLRISYAGILNPMKSLSDQIIYHPVKYKILFGTSSAVSGTTTTAGSGSSTGSSGAGY